MAVETIGQSAVRFSGDLQMRQDQGKLVALATVFYNPETDQVEHYFPEAITPEEAIAILKAFHCYPIERRKR